MGNPGLIAQTVGALSAPTDVSEVSMSMDIVDGPYRYLFVAGAYAIATSGHDSAPSVFLSQGMTEYPCSELLRATGKSDGADWVMYGLANPPVGAGEIYFRAASGSNIRLWAAAYEFSNVVSHSNSDFGQWSVSKFIGPLNRSMHAILAAIEQSSPGGGPYGYDLDAQYYVGIGPVGTPLDTNNNGFVFAATFDGMMSPPSIGDLIASGGSSVEGFYMAMNVVPSPDPSFEASATIEISASASLDIGYIPLSGSAGIEIGAEADLNTLPMYGLATITIDAVLTPPESMAYSVGYPSAGSEFSYGRVTAVTMDEAPNQARVLNMVQHIRATDFTSALNVGDLVYYVDPDMGSMFWGKIFRRQWIEGPGEGWMYTAADRGRALMKNAARLRCVGTEPAYISGSMLGTTRFHIRSGTKVSAAISMVMATMVGSLSSDSTSGWFPGGIDYDLDPDLELYRSLDKAGMTIANWLDDILDQTSGGCWNVIYQPGVGPQLRVYDYYSQPGYTFKSGNYDSGRGPYDAPFSPVHIEAGPEQTADEKYYRVNVEGGGSWSRIHGGSFSADYAGLPVSLDPPNNFNWRTSARFYFPETNIDGWYYDASGLCSREIRFYLSYSYAQGSPASTFSGDAILIRASVSQDTDSTLAWQGFPSASNPSFCRYYIDYYVDHGGLGSSGNSQPAVAAFYGLSADYTALMGINSAIAPSGPFSNVNREKLKEEGDFVIQRMDLVNFSQSDFYSSFGSSSVLIEAATTIDHQASMQEIADLYYTRYGVQPSLTGDLTLHMASVVAQPRPGYVLGQYSATCRIRDIHYEFVNRNFTLNFSDLPLRDVIQEAKKKQVANKSFHLNWREREAQTLEQCIEGVVLYNDATNCGCKVVDKYAAEEGYGS